MRFEGQVCGTAYPVSDPAIAEAGRPPRRKHRRRGSSNARAVERDDGKVFASVRDAADSIFGCSSRRQADKVKYSCLHGKAAFGHRWRYVGDEWPEYVNVEYRPVVDVDTGERWASVAECARALGASRHSVRYALDAGRDSYCGRRIRYADR